MEELVLNEVLVDWITLTSFDQGVQALLTSVAESVINRDNRVYSTWLGYVGVSDGKVFVGEQVIAGERHVILRASGIVADRIVRDYADKIKKARCTRLDLQLTIRLDGRELMESLVRHAKEKGMAHAVYVSDTMTVYLYSRKSRKFLRVYQKPPGLIRIEFELKDTYAQSYLNAILTPFQLGKEREQVFQYLIEAVGHPELNGVVKGAEKLKPVMVKHYSKTDEWLLNSVLKTVQSRAMQNEEVLLTYLEALQRIAALRKWESGMVDVLVAGDTVRSQLPLPFPQAGVPSTSNLKNGQNVDR